jgi:hypothetical protein
LQAQYAFGVSGYAGFQVFQSLLNSCSLERKFNKKVAVGQFAPIVIANTKTVSMSARSGTISDRSKVQNPQQMSLRYEH